MSLTNEQLAFLRIHGLNENLFFNASGLSKTEYSSKMKALGKKVAYNVTPCMKGHTLRSRHGHCLQYDTARITFITRDIGTVYLAGSRVGKVFKIGFTKGKNLREESLNRKNEGYGGYTDWEILFWIESPNAGYIEQKAHARLRRFQVFKLYTHEGRSQETTEMFKCDYDQAKSAIVFGLKEEDPSIAKEKNHRLHRYHFNS